MKREDIQAKLPDIPKETLDWIMGENGKDIQREKDAAAALQIKLDAANNQLSTVQTRLAAFDGVDVEAMRQQLATLQTDLTAQREGFEFDAALAEAVHAAGGHSVKAIRAMLDVDALKASKNRTADIGAALEALKASDGWAFNTPAEIPAMRTSGGTEHGIGGTADATLQGQIISMLYPSSKQ